MTTPNNEYRLAWDDLKQRLQRADGELRGLYDEHYEAGYNKRGPEADSDVAECRRIASKRAGIKLALDYMRGYAL